MRGRRFTAAAFGKYSLILLRMVKSEKRDRVLPVSLFCLAVFACRSKEDLHVFSFQRRRPFLGGANVGNQRVDGAERGDRVKRDDVQLRIVRQQVTLFRIFDEQAADARLVHVRIGQPMPQVDAAAGEKAGIEMVVFQFLQRFAAHERQAVFAQFSADAVDFAVVQFGEHQNRLGAVGHDAQAPLGGEPRYHERRRGRGIEKDRVSVAYKFRGALADLLFGVGTGGLAHKKRDLAVQPLVENGAAVRPRDGSALRENVQIPPQRRFVHKQFFGKLRHAHRLALAYQFENVFLPAGGDHVVLFVFIHLPPSCVFDFVK